LLKQGVLTVTPEQKEQLKSAHTSPGPSHALCLTPAPTATDEFAALRVDELTAPHPAMAKYFAAQTALETQLRLDEERLHSTAAGTSTDSSSLQAGASSGSAGAAQRGGKAVAAACLSLALPLPRNWDQ
jgi:hypothetical protein